jgi:hypothetical protein
MQKRVEAGKLGNESSLSSHGASDNAKEPNSSALILAAL